MAVLSANNVAKSFGADDIFEGVSVDIPHGAKIALVGTNGIGKTTLLEVLIKKEEPSAGTVSHMKGLTVGYLPQRPQLVADRSLWTEMLTAFDDIRKRERQLAKLTDAMSDTSRDDLDDVIERYGRMEQQFELDGGYTYEMRIRQVLHGLGFKPDEYQMPLSHLSGGQQTRALLARLLLESPDLLVLDEPTNHLDINAVEWLESFLKTWPGALLVVSHDRYFMDNVITVIWEMDWGRVDVYRGNYSHYIQQREDRHARLQKEYEAQQEFIAKEEDYIRRNISGQNTSQAKGRLRRLERLKRDRLIARPRSQHNIRLDLNADLRSGEKVLMTYDLVAGYERDKPLVRVPDITLYRTEIAAMIGPNGVGKTTLLRTLLNELAPLSGSSRLGAAVQPGYFAQAHERLNQTNGVLDELLTVRNLPISEARNYLAAFLFTGDDVFRPVSTLSGGERGRLALAKLALNGDNFLLLDEPTNHLDIPSQEILQAVLAGFNGTILLVSHDRYLIDALATQIWDVQPGKMTVFEGTYREYLQAREVARQTGREIENMPSQPPQSRDGKAVSGAQRSNGKPRLSEFERTRRLAAIEQQINDLEIRLVNLSGELGEASSAGAVDRVRDLGEQYAATETELNIALETWESLLEQQ
ncbi:MAG: ABC-F family ATP-binding cassette domain-containing protein [Anaerolineae bacterium]|nr:ABC-F family ATP-binding cassette domain-containing protein [Anaerolineae bacterium]